MTVVIMFQVMKETKTSTTHIISNKEKWYQFHTGTQGGSDMVTKDH